MMGALQDMLNQQALLQKVMDKRSDSSDPQTRCEYFKDMSMAAMLEIAEMVEETGWKPWSSSWHINREQAMAEWIDVWHFMMNCANALEMTEGEIVARYEQKAAINRERAASNYDGVSTKCPGCKRALDDPATKCYYKDDVTRPLSAPPRLVWCMENKKLYSIPKS
jgi:dimeric dUTPase (all-alpha-NTP-PPase superfamily)